MLIMPAGDYHYTDVRYTFDGETPTTDELVELALLQSKVADDGWQVVWTDRTSKGIFILYRREESVDPLRSLRHLREAPPL